MNNNDLLPIGSVVLLKNATHRLMIIGYGAIKYGNPSLVYDYWGCPYPEGQYEAEKHMIFDSKDIDKIIAEGYSDDSEKDFRKKIVKMLSKCRNAKHELTATESDLVDMAAGKED